MITGLVLLVELVRNNADYPTLPERGAIVVVGARRALSLPALWISRLPVQIGFSFWGRPSGA